MSSKKWVMTFFICIFVILVLFVAFNLAVDPFGAFGDPIFNWFSYNETMNPRIAKIEYLEEHFDDYDSYIVGCSSTSSYPVEQLNEYLNADFYNAFTYGADMYDTELTVAYLLEHDDVKNIFLNLYIDNGAHYDIGEDDVTAMLNRKVSGQNPLTYYTKLLLLNPRYGIEKLTSLAKDTEMPQSFDVFNVETGAYDKRARDAENIGSMEDYLTKYPAFANYPHWTVKLNEIDACVQSVARIKAMCDAAGVRLIVVNAPIYCEYLYNCDVYEVIEFYTALASVTEYYDFAMSSISCDPRYFYDETHFRNSVGEMALAYIFEDDSVYRPADFGFHVTAENADELAAYYSQELTFSPEILTDSDYAVSVPVLMYHHIAEETNDVTITPSLFEEHMQAILDAGYTPVFPEELMDYVNCSGSLPDNPILITFDDGYYSNYEYAFPILQKYNMKATIFAIGATIGCKETYKDTEYPITPHFDLDEAREMLDSGLIHIQSHTYDMHQSAAYDPAPARENALILDGESEPDYIRHLTEDHRKMVSIIETELGCPLNTVAYPNGQYDALSQWILQTEGVSVTLSTDYGVSAVIRGLPQSLLSMKRMNISEDVSVEALLAYLAG